MLLQKILIHDANDVLNMHRSFKDEATKQGETTSSDHTARHQGVLLDEVGITKHAVNTICIKLIVSGNAISVHNGMK